jgi:hypothetical protein
MIIQTSEELQSQAMKMSPEHIKASQESGLLMMQYMSSIMGECDDDMLEPTRLGAIIAITDFLEMCTAPKVITIVEG